MEIKEEGSQDSYSSNKSHTFIIDSCEVNPKLANQAISLKKENEEVMNSSTIPTGTRWSPGNWHDPTRKSAFQPYKPSLCTVLTNLQRGNTQAETPVPREIDINFHTRAGQGEITVRDINNESSVDILDNNNLTALHWAAAYGQINSVNLLLNHGANVNYNGPEGETPLLLAAAGGHHDVVRMLLNRGASVNHCDHVGNTALMYAAYGDHPHSCNELLLRNADVTISDHAGDNAFSLAANNNSKSAQTVIENYLLTLLQN